MEWKSRNQNDIYGVVVPDDVAFQLLNLLQQYAIPLDPYQDRTLDIDSIAVVLKALDEKRVQIKAEIKQNILDEIRARVFPEWAQNMFDARLNRHLMFGTYTELAALCRYALEKRLTICVFGQ